MSRRTYEKDADFVEVADDLETLVADKRIRWRASATKARRRQRSTNRKTEKAYEAIICKTKIT